MFGCLFAVLIAFNAVLVLSLPSINRRPDGFDVVSFLQKFNSDISPSWLALKFAKMEASPFIFYRGSDQLFFLDWSYNGALESFGNSTTRVWIQGDMHVENMGSFMNSGGDVVYEANDFDESLVGPYQLDVWRMATSIVLVAREKNFTQADTSSLVVAFATSYVKTVLSFVGSKDGPEDTYFGSKTTNGELKDFLQDVEKTMSRKAMLSKWVDADTGKFNTNLPDLQPVSEVLKQRIVDAWPAYMSTTKISDKSFFNIVDIARRVNAGTGSLGKNRFYVLIQGDSKKDGTNRILDVKQGGFPVALSFLNDRDRAEYQSWFPNIASEGARAGIAYRAWCVRVDPTLGSLFMAIDNPQNTTYPPIPWVFGVRERSPWKDTWDYESDGSLKNMNSMVGWWGRILATQHCRTDARYAKGIYVHTLFPESLSQFFSGGNNTDVFIAQVQQVASIYADQVNQDFASFVAHVNDTKMIKTTS